MPRQRPQITQPVERKSLEGWTQCSACKSSIAKHLYQAAFNVCPNCGDHGRLTAEERISLLVDPGSFEKLYEPAELIDPLTFTDTESYAQRWEKAQKKSGVDEALIWGKASIETTQVILAVMDFSFMGGSMGSTVGERLTQCCESAELHRLPLIVICASGGARMQEGIFSLLQMAKTALAFRKLHQQKIPVITILTDPTCGGVTASFGTLGDLILAEPGALICFTGPRVIEQNLRQKLPPEAQKSEFLLARGMIDQIVPRRQQKATLARLCRYLQPSPSVGE